MCHFYRCFNGIKISKVNSRLQCANCSTLKLYQVEGSVTSSRTYNRVLLKKHRLDNYTIKQTDDQSHSKQGVKNTQNNNYNKMSFFARLGSDSDSDSSGSDSEESILSGEEGERQDARIARPAGRANQFLRSDDDDSDEDDSDDDDSADEAPVKSVCLNSSKVGVQY